MTPRAAASTSRRPSAPSRTAAEAVELGLRERRRRRGRNSLPTSPVAKVRVMSLQYPSSRAPVSITTISSRPIRRVSGDGMGSAPRSPAATIVANDRRRRPGRAALHAAPRRPQPRSSPRSRRRSPRQRGVDDLRGAAQGLDLGLILDVAQATQPVTDVAQPAHVTRRSARWSGVAQHAALKAEDGVGAAAARATAFAAVVTRSASPTSTSSSPSTSSWTCAKKRESVQMSATSTADDQQRVVAAEPGEVAHV